MAGTTRTTRSRKAAEKPEQTPTEALAAASIERPTALTPEVLRDLRRPFTVEAVKFKPQTVTKDKQKAMATFYIDARLAAERLNAVVGPENWTTTPRVLFEDNPQAHAGFHFPVECALTVFGVTKVDVGVYQKAKPDPLAVKSAYSDSLKRAAVLFGIGAYLYAMPKVWAPTKTYGSGDNMKVDGFSEAGERMLRQAYEKALREMRDRFGDPIDHGDLTDPETQDAPPEPDAGPVTPAEVEMVESKDEISRMVALAEQAGIPRDEALKVCANEKQAHGGYRRSWLTEQLQTLNAAIQQKAKAA